MKKRILAFLLTVVMVVSLLPVSAFAEEPETEATEEGKSTEILSEAAAPTEELTAEGQIDGQEPPAGSQTPVAKIGETPYATLAGAVAEANEGETVEIVEEGTYTVPNISKNITIKAATGVGVVFNCVGTGSIASIPNGCTFENVTFNMGTENYHGFQHAGLINMTNCTINGKFFSYGHMNFTTCTFNAPSGDYSMWLYGLDVTFTSCIFNGTGKFFNVFNEGVMEYTITVDSCTANNTGNANKAVFNSKETCTNGNILNNRVVLMGANTYTGNAPAVGDIVLNSFVQVDDRAAEAKRTAITALRLLLLTIPL